MPAPAASSAAARARARRDLVEPRQREVLHRRLVDLRERAVPPARVVAVVGRPRVLQRLQDVRGIEPLALAQEEDGQEEQGQEQERSLRGCFQTHMVVITFSALRKELDV